MAIGIIGFCRFSFLGLGDWAAYRTGGGPPKLTDAVMASVAAKIYTPQRLDLRFWLFENLLLPSMRAQTDQDFTLVVLTSPEMPAPYLQRLQAMVADMPTVQVVVSAERTCKDALLPVVAAFREQRGHPVQFRIDDDDCVAVNFIKDLRGAAKTLRGLKSYAVTMPQSLVMAAYSGQPAQFFKMYSMFHSAGCACYTEDAGKTVFSTAHTLWHKKVTSLVLPQSTSAFMTKFDGHDADGLFFRNKRKDLSPVQREDIGHVFDRRFPFLKTLDFAPATRLAAAPQPVA